MKRNGISIASYRKYRKALNYILNVAEDEFYTNKFISMGNDRKQKTEVLNDIYVR